jgi:hypothetical protein
MVRIFAILSFLVYPLIGQTGPQPRPRPMVSSLTTYFTQIVPLVIVGEGWSQRVVFLNVDTTRPVIGTLQFYTKDGEPWQVQTKDQGTASTFLVNLQPGQTAMFETVVKTGGQQLGWARLDLTTQGLGDVFGQTIFHKQTPGLPDFMCSMVLGGQGYSKLSVFFDNTGGKFTGMGILSSDLCTFSPCQPFQLNVTVKGLDGGVISQRAITQNLGALYWMNLGVDFPETVGRIGTFTVEVAQQYSTTLTGFSLQFAGNAFTVITPFEQ